MRFVLAGGRGSLGQRLAQHFNNAGHEVVILTRSPDRSHDRNLYREVAWDGSIVGPWAAELEGATVINLAGELVDKRPTEDNIALLRTSRVAPPEPWSRHRTAAPCRPSCGCR